MNNLTLLTERGKIQKQKTERKYQTELYGPRHKYSNGHQQNKFRYDLFIRSVYPYEQFYKSSFYYNS